MRSIVIVGAGIGGCTTYLFLKKYLSSDISVHIYESYPAPPYLSNLNRSKPTASLDLFVSEGDSQEATKTTAGSTPNVTTAIGGWLGLSPNGLRVLKSLDHGIYECVKAIGVEVDVFGAQVRSGRMLGNFKVGGKRYGEGTLLVARAAVHDAVLKEIKSNDISFNKKVKRVIDGDTTVRIEFEDGGSVDADLVIGADGVWGKTREAIPECARFKPEYDGMVGIGAMLDDTTTRKVITDLKSKKDLVIPKNLITLTFGSGAFFGTVIDKKRLEQPLSKDRTPSSHDLDVEVPLAGWWSTFPAEPAPTSRTPFSEVKDMVMAKHKGWTPLIPALIENSDLDMSGNGTFVLPRWITPSLPKWTSDSGRILLVGDAAHCMPPDSGQGLSCAVEDAMTIGLLCSDLFPTSSNVDPNKDSIPSSQHKLRQLCELYVKIRKPRCDYIVAEARKRGDMKRELTWWDEAIRNLFIMCMCRIMPDSANDAFFSWDAETEVAKALMGGVPAVKGKGKVRADADK